MTPGLCTSLKLAYCCSFQHAPLHSLSKLCQTFTNFPLLVTKSPGKKINFISAFSAFHQQGTDYPVAWLFAAGPSCMHLQDSLPLCFCFVLLYPRDLFLAWTPWTRSLSSGLTASHVLSLPILIAYTRLLPPCKFVCLNKKRQNWLVTTSVPRLGKPSAKLSDTGPHPALPVGTLCSSSSLLVPSERA